MKMFPVVLVMTLAGFSAATARATTPNTQPRSRTVSYADLNLHSQQGIARLHARIRAAAREVCDSDAPASLRAVARERACAAEAVARALAAIPALLEQRDARLVMRRPWLMERVMGIEPTLVAWEATVLPLNYTRAL